MLDILDSGLTLDKPKELLMAESVLCRPTVLSADCGVAAQHQTRTFSSVTIFETYVEAISPSDMAIAVDPTPARMQPYTNDAGPPLSSANWKVNPTVSHPACSVKPKLMIDRRLMYFCKTGSVGLETQF